MDPILVTIGVIWVLSKMKKQETQIEAPAQSAPVADLVQRIIETPVFATDAVPAGIGESQKKPLEDWEIANELIYEKRRLAQAGDPRYCPIDCMPSFAGSEEEQKAADDKIKADCAGREIVCVSF